MYSSLNKQCNGEEQSALIPLNAVTKIRLVKWTKTIISINISIHIILMNYMRLILLRIMPITVQSTVHIFFNL